MENCNGVMDEVQKYFELAPLKHADRVVVWNDYMHGQIQVIKQSKVPVIMVQNGRMDNNYPYQDLYRDYPFLADRVCVWGTGDKEDLLKVGIPEEKIFITGTTIYDNIQKKPHQQFTVAFVPCHDKEFEEENIRISEQLRRTGYRIITKITDSQPPYKFINPVPSNRFASNHLSLCAKVVAEADVVLSNDVSTFEFMAHYLKIPVVRKIEDIANARYDAEEAIKILQRRGQYEQALEKMIKVITM